MKYHMVSTHMKCYREEKIREKFRVGEWER